MLRELYEARYATVLITVAQKIEAELRKLLKDIENIDRISARAKEVESFLKKAAKKNEDDSLKYAEPLKGIQDQIGARIVVYYKADLEIVSDVIRRMYSQIEEQTKGKDDVDAFGYEGRHFIVAIPSDVAADVQNKSDLPMFFELQVKTVFQHAWAAANHDLVYKSPVELTPEQKRMCAYAAAQAWGADRIFADLHQEVLGLLAATEVQNDIGLNP